MPNPIVNLGNSKTILEGDSGFQELTIDITLSSTSTDIVQVPYSIGAGGDTAIIDDDYAIDGLLPIIFNPGDPTTKTLTFKIFGDLLVEPDKIFTISLGTPIGATLGTQTSATITILNNDQLPVVTIASVTNASEAGTAGSIVLSRTGNLDLPTQVSLSFADSSAAVNTDYQPLPTVATFQAGVSQIVIPVTAIDDDLYEGNENIKVSLVTSPNYTLGSTSTNNVQILDNEVQPTITVTPLSQSVTEKNSGDPANAASFTVSLSGKSSTPVTVNYATADGTAAATADYTATTGTITFLAGVTTPQTITIPISPDNIFEPDESFNLNFSNAVGAGLSNSTLAVTIINDDPVPLPLVTVVPISTTNEAGAFRFRRTGDSTAPLTIDYSITKSTANQQPQADTITFVAGQSEVDLLSNLSSGTIFQEIENVNLVLTDRPTYATSAGTKSAALQFTNSQPIPSISIGDVSLVEGDAGTTNMVFAVRLSAPVAQAVTANFTTANGTALAGSDFTAVAGTLSFAAREIEKTISVPVLGDQVVEADENFSLALSNISFGIAGRTSAVGTIANNDVAVASVSVPTPNASEPATNGQFAIDLSTTSEIPISVQYTLGGTATAGQDYQTIPGSVVFAPGQTRKLINVTTIDDNLLEGPESVQLTLQAGTNYSIQTGANTGTATIADNEQLPTVVSIASVTNAKEGGPVGAIVLSRTGTINIPTTVNVSFTGGSATSGVDYQALPTSVTFNAGESQVSIGVSAIDDDLYEGNENFQVSLLIGTTYSVSGSGTNNVLIEDNEIKPNIAITPTSQSILEKNIGDAANQASFTVSLTGKSNAPITVDYFTTDGTATADSDYIATTGTITFAAGTMSQVINIPIIPDNSVEPDEYFEVNLANPVGADISPSIAQVGVEATIVNDDSLPLISVISINDTVPNVGRFQFKRLGDLSIPLTVSYKISKSTDGSQPPQEETVTFEIGQSAVDLPLTVSSSTIFQEIENISISLADQADYQTVAATKSAVLQLTSNAPAPNFEIADASLVEGDSGSSNLVFTVRLTAPSAQTITTDYATANDTAIAGVDFTAVSGSLNFAPQEVEKTIAVPILGDQIVEADEEFKLLLSNVTLGALGVPDRTTARGTVVNNDTAIASVAVPIANAGEPATNGQFAIDLSTTSEIPITVEYSLGGSATTGQDYQTMPTSVTFVPGQTRKLIDVNIIDDTTLEGSETVQLSLQAGTSYSVQTSASSGVVTIADNEKPAVGKPTLKKADSNIFTIENGVGQPTTLRFRKLSHQAFNRNEVGLFTVDNESGAIGGILPGQNGYLQAAVQKSQVIFSALGDGAINASLDATIDRYISLSDTSKLGFYLVADATTDDVKDGKNASVILLSSGNSSERYVNFLDVANGQTQFSWEDTRGGDNDFNDLVFQVELAQSPVTPGAEQQGTLEILDLRNLSGRRTLSLEIGGDAWFSNTVGFYQVDDLTGRVNGLAPGSEGYLAAALSKVVASGKKGESPTVQVDGGTILAPFLIANGSVQSFLADVKSANVYLGNIAGKSADGFDHLRLLGDNKFAFEDLWGGGDRDYNDSTVKVSIV